ncbi:MAG: sulfite exporter TauE/SafE family protein [Acidobacteria bacterium]|nr:sulfite exporter TauE/SafE family protein [Acidobacteriota bacterium]
MSNPCLSSLYRRSPVLSGTLQLLVIVVLGGLVHGVTGFGFGLFTMGVLSVLMPMGDAVTIVSLINLVITLLNLWTLRGSVDWRESWPVLGAAIPTTILGVYLLRSLDTGLLRTGVGVMILMGCAVALWSPQRARLRGANPWGYVAGLVGGVFGGALNTGGPPVVLYTLLRGWDKARTKSVMTVYFAGTGILRVALLIATGVATAQRLQQGVVLLAPAAAATFLGTRVFRRMSTPVFRYAVTGLLALLAARTILS